MKICPLCGAILQTGPKRICSQCHLPIRQRDKWRIGADGRLQHKDCENTQLLDSSEDSEPPWKSKQMRMAE